MKVQNNNSDLQRQGVLADLEVASRIKSNLASSDYPIEETEEEQEMQVTQPAFFDQSRTLQSVRLGKDMLIST